MPTPTTDNLRSIETARRAVRQQAAAERGARIAAYRALLAAPPAAKMAVAAAPAAARAAAVASPRVLADGDSWFEYPLILGTNGGTIDHLQSLSNIAILNTAHHGDSVTETLGVEKRQRIEALLQDPGFDVLLFSGHGDPTTAINTARLGEILDIVVAGYRDLIDIRDRHAPNCWIVTHAYDFPQPTGEGVCGLGPWLLASLKYRGWTDGAAQFAVVKQVLMALNDRFVALETEQKAAGKNFLHVRTQGTLNVSTDWDNEIHPNDAGFTKLAKKFSAALNAIYPAFPTFP